jgi:hypothetical protein
MMLDDTQFAGKCQAGCASEAIFLCDVVEATDIGTFDKPASI